MGDDLTLGSLADVSVDEDEEENVPEASSWRYLWDARRVAHTPARRTWSAESSVERPADRPVRHDDLDVFAEALPVPPELSWCSPDSASEALPFLQRVLDEILLDHYVEDAECAHRVKCTLAALEWSLLGPNAVPEDLILGLRDTSGAIVAFITATPMSLFIEGSETRVALIDYVCVHRAWRSKRLCPLLYQEVQRRCRARGIQVHVKTTGQDLPGAIASSHFFHFLMPHALQKLMVVGFTYVPVQGPRNWEHVVQNHPQNRSPEESGVMLVPLTVELLESARKLHQDHSMRLFPRLARVYDSVAFAHDLLPREGVVTTLVRVEGGEVTDLISFSHLETVHQHATTEDGWEQGAWSGKDELEFRSVLTGEIRSERPQGELVLRSIRAAHLVYNVAETVPRQELISAALSHLEASGIDVVSALDIMGLWKESLVTAGFGVGTGLLRYYICGLQFSDIEPEEIAIKPGV